MAKKEKKNSDLFLKAFRKSNREIQFLRNGGGQFVSQHKVWKNNKKYNRKRDRNIDIDGLFCFIMGLVSCLFVWL